MSQISCFAAKVSQIPLSGLLFLFFFLFLFLFFFFSFFLPCFFFFFFWGGGLEDDRKTVSRLGICGASLESAVLRTLHCQQVSPAVGFRHLLHSCSVPQGWPFRACAGLSSTNSIRCCPPTTYQGQWCSVLEDKAELLFFSSSCVY